jgi:hypothetical protein
MDNFSNAVGHDDALTFAVFMDAVATLEANDAPRPYNCVLDPRQVYGSFGLSAEFGNIAAVNGSNGAFTGMAGTAEQQFMGVGQVTTLAGIGIYTTTAVLDGATGRKEAGMFSQQAIGCGFIDFGGGNFIQMATEREEAYAKTTLVANAYYAAAELVDAYGVEIDTEIS